MATPEKAVSTLRSSPKYRKGYPVGKPDREKSSHATTMPVYHAYWVRHLERQRKRCRRKPLIHKSENKQFANHVKSTYA